MGIQAMKAAMAKAGLAEPKFETDGFFRAVFRRPAKASTDASRRGSQKILELAKGRPDITIDQLSAELGISTRAVKKHLSALKGKGLLKRIGPDKGGHWEVTQ